MVRLLNQSFGHVVTDTATCTRHKNFFGVHFAAGEEGGFDAFKGGRETALPCPFFTVGKRHCCVFFTVGDGITVSLQILCVFSTVGDGIAVSLQISGAINRI